MQPERNTVVLLATVALLLFATMQVSSWRSNTSGIVGSTQRALDRPFRGGLPASNRQQLPPPCDTNQTRDDSAKTQQPAAAAVAAPPPPAQSPPSVTQLLQLVEQLLQDRSSHSQLREAGFDMLKRLNAIGSLPNQPHPNIPLQTMEKFWGTILKKQVV